MARTITMRASKEFRDVVNFIIAKYIMEGKKPPKISSITAVIAKKTNKEELLNDCFIRF